ncbi:MAG: lipoyl(octanoyl) transferase LipB [Rickettsiaceae bacterium]
MPRWITLEHYVEYAQMLLTMEGMVERVINDDAEEVIYLLEHQDVYTAGSGYTVSDLLSDDINIVHTGRGGKVTYHGPGQRIIYPILNLLKPNRKKDLKLYINMLQYWIIQTLSHFSIKAYTRNDHIGIWTIDSDNNESKIASIGIRVRKWVTYHGIAVNIDNDLSKFNHIIPCGIRNVKNISLKQLGVNVAFAEFDLVLKATFYKIFN